MAHGYPDWHRGSIIEGIRNGEAKGVNLDDLGNLVALLKGVYEGIPTILACDENGNINVNVQVLSAATPIEPATAGTIFKTTEQTPLTEIKVKNLSGTANIPVTESAPLTEIKVKNLSGTANIPVTESAPLTQIKVEPLAVGTVFKTTEQSPLTSIQVEPKAGMGNLLVNLNAQSSDYIKTNDYLGLYTAGQGSGSLTANTTKTIFSVNGNILLHFCRLYLSDIGGIDDDYINIVFNGAQTVSFWLGIPSTQSLRDVPWSFFTCDEYNNVDNTYSFVLNRPLRAHTSLAISVSERNGRTPSYNFDYFYSLI